MSEPHPLAVGIDIGGSKTAVGLVDAACGTIIEQRLLDTPDRGSTSPDFLQGLAAISRELCANHRAEGAALPVGIGVCEFVEPSHRIVTSLRVALDIADIRAAFSDFRSVAVEADVRAAAIAEARFGRGQGLEHWIYVNAGTGIGSVLMQGDRCYAGAHGWALGLGMSPLNFRPAGADDESAVVEQYSGGAGLLSVARARGLPVATVRDLIALGRSGSEAMAEVLRDGGSVLGRAVALLINLLDPEAVIVGGGLASAEIPYLTALRAVAAEHVWHVPAKATPVQRAAFAGEGGLIGAALSACRP